LLFILGERDVRRRKRIEGVLAVFLLLYCLTGALFAQNEEVTPLTGKNVPVQEGNQLLQVGSRAPFFKAKDLNGNSFTFQPTGKGGVLLVFWSIFCEPSRYEMPIVEKLHRNYGRMGLEVVAVSIDGHPLKNAIAGFVKQEGYSFRVLVDEIGEDEIFKVAAPFGVAGTPTLYIVDKSGIITFSHEGTVKEKELDNAVAKVLKKSAR
jgi:cytochrome c biogenesis protein CcmG/thiol:disulfide interchange protein DsbE